MKWKFCILLGLFLVGLTTTAANSVPPPSFLDPYQVYQHRYQWASHRITSYRFELERICMMCIEGRSGIRVNNGEAVLEEINPNPDADLIASDYTIEKLFDRLQRTIKAKPSYLVVKYDPLYGFPSYISVDFDKDTFDDEITLHIRNFEP